MFRCGTIAGSAVAVLLLLKILVTPSVSRENVIWGNVDRGTITVSLNAAGNVVPKFEEYIISPVSSRILAVYKNVGDKVTIGTPLLKLDLQSVKTDYEKMQDELRMKQYELGQLKVNNRTGLNELRMQIKVAEMKISQRRADLKNERCLDSIGSGTTEKVHQAELDLSVATLELEQMRQKFDNQKLVCDADYKVKLLDYNMFLKGLQEKKRVLDQAGITAPRDGVVTYISSQIGEQISEGRKIAVLSDLSSFKVEGIISDAQADNVKIGNPATVKIENRIYNGVIANVSPLSNNNATDFTVVFPDDSVKGLHSGSKAEVFVVEEIKSNVLRIPNGSFYTGPGVYSLFVEKNGKLYRREVEIGKGNYDYVEVMRGLKEGEHIVVSGMEKYKSSNTLRIKK